MRALTQHPKLRPSGTTKLLAGTDIPFQDPHPIVGAWQREDDASTRSSSQPTQRPSEGTRDRCIPKGVSRASFPWLVT